MQFEWDATKNAINRRKHGLEFEPAARVFDDPNCVLYVERIEANEERWHAIGAIMGTVIVTVAHNYRSEQSDEIIRIVSARRATPKERRMYVEAI